MIVLCLVPWCLCCALNIMVVCGMNICSNKFINYQGLGLVLGLYWEIVVVLSLVTLFWGDEIWMFSWCCYSSEISPNLRLETGLGDGNKFGKRLCPETTSGGSQFGREKVDGCRSLWSCWGALWRHQCSERGQSSSLSSTGVASLDVSHQC